MAGHVGRMLCGHASHMGSSHACVVLLSDCEPRCCACPLNGVRGPRSGVAAVTLLLQDLLADERPWPNCAAIPERRAHVGARLEDLLLLLAPLHLSALQVTLPQRAQLHASTATAFTRLTKWNGTDTLQTVSLYVDGSFVPQDDTAGWAVVAIEMSAGVEVWIGFASGPMACPCLPIGRMHILLSWMPWSLPLA